ncbi:hypothetical protein A9Q94_12275 [Rhodobacterales bacterium 56_14_T64]|nr:hypothetical protein A9Q94_12275 [Rhodobacterales bacterium 56_14_T64]
MNIFCAVLLMTIATIAPVAHAQMAPLVTATLTSPDTPVGQPVTLTIEVLVPTWMPSPPVLPDLEQPDLLVRQPPRAGSPISRKIDDETWSGISRRYLLIPLKSGRFDLPAAELELTWADPETRAPITQKLSVSSLSLTATVPTDAQDLNPPLLAQDIQLDQVIEGGPELQVGDPITRTVTAQITGTTPILMPLLLRDLEDQSTLRTYPGEPKTSEDLQRGTLSGSRIETVTYLAQNGGKITLPDIELHWFDLDDGIVKTIRLQGATFDIAEPPPPPLDAAAIAFRAIVALVVLLLTLWSVRRLTPWISYQYQILKERWLFSPHYARRQVISALKTRDLSACYLALDLWQRAVPSQTRRREVTDLLLPIGKAQYSGTAPDGSANHWRDAEKRFSTYSQAVLRRRNTMRKKTLMDHLNP